jgi:hypothetical protein
VHPLANQTDDQGTKDTGLIINTLDEIDKDVAIDGAKDTVLIIRILEDIDNHLSL